MTRPKTLWTTRDRIQRLGVGGLKRVCSMVKMYVNMESSEILHDTDVSGKVVLVCPCVV